MTDASEHLRALARRIASAHVAHMHPVAVLLTGSAALGTADHYSDIDLIVYHDAVPLDDALERARLDLGVTDFRWLIPRAEHSMAEAYRLDGVECQVAHGTVADWERTIADVRSGREPATPDQKALAGLLYGLPLHGEERIAAWQALARDFPEPLAHAMVHHYARQIFPIWYIADSLPARDAALWVQQTLVEIAFAVLGVLAGLNRRYYSAFQFKHMHAFVDSLALKPANLAERLGALGDSDQAAAIAHAEALVHETLDLLARHLPEIDVPSLGHQPGERHQPWR